MFDNIAEQVFQQTIETTRSTGCTPLLADMFLHTYEADIFKLVLNRTLIQIFSSSFRTIDDVSSLRNSRRLSASNLSKIKLDIQYTTETQSLLIIFTFTLKSTAEKDYKQNTTTNVMTLLLQKPTSTISYKIPATPLYCVYVQFRPYFKACNQYGDFLDISQLLTQNILKQDYANPGLKSSQHKFYGRHLYMNANKCDVTSCTKDSSFQSISTYLLFA